MASNKLATSLGELKKSKYNSRSVKEELRQNLIIKLKKGETVFSGILGFDDTVLPDLERAILSRHSILLLGLRGQAKTRLARLLVSLLDEWMPIIEGSELNDDPLNPISKAGKLTIEEMGDKTPIQWIHRDERYVEKLATPDVSVADLIGDVDPIKAATLKLPYSDERVIHFGLIPRAHRCIFVINELPDLQARIQVSLFNILQEGDIQIRGFKLRLPLDIQFVSTANPEDYTNRGSIITPLKDRIESQILTHYPRSLAIAKEITSQEAKITTEQINSVTIFPILLDLIERISFAARESEFIDEKSGVSARLSISALENLYSTAERRMLINGEPKAIVRVADFWGIIPAITGKVELVYEGEQEGPYNVALALMNKAIKALFLSVFMHPDKMDKSMDRDPFGTLRSFFGAGNSVDLEISGSSEHYKSKLESIPGLKKLVAEAGIPKEEQYLMMEFVLHGLSEFDIISKELINARFSFKDLLTDMLYDDDGGFRDN